MKKPPNPQKYWNARSVKKVILFAVYMENMSESSAINVPPGLLKSLTTMLRSTFTVIKIRILYICNKYMKVPTSAPIDIPFTRIPNIDEIILHENKTRYWINCQNAPCIQLVFANRYDVNSGCVCSQCERCGERYCIDVIKKRIVTRASGKVF
jgi:hypothetical protein